MQAFAFYKRLHFFEPGSGSFMIVPCVALLYFRTLSSPGSPVHEVHVFWSWWCWKIYPNTTDKEPVNSGTCKLLELRFVAHISNRTSEWHNRRCHNYFSRL